VECGQNHAGGLSAEARDGELVDRPVQIRILIGLVGCCGVVFVKSRRIGNRRLKEELELRLAYPTVDAGIAAALARRNAC